MHLPQGLLLQLPISVAVGAGLYPRFAEHALPPGPAGRKCGWLTPGAAVSRKGRICTLSGSKGGCFSLPPEFPVYKAPTTLRIGWLYLCC